MLLFGALNLWPPQGPTPPVLFPSEPLTSVTPLPVTSDAVVRDPAEATVDASSGAVSTVS